MHSRAGMTVARQVIPGRTYLISRRCTQRQFFLRPDLFVERVYLYCLDRAVKRFKISLHGFVAMSNHHHLLIRDNLGNFPEFLAYLHLMIAKNMNAHFGRWENFWAAEQASAVYLVEPDDCFAKLIYLLANPIEQDLVDRISDWPGASSLGLHFSDQPRTIKRPKGYFRSGEEAMMPETVTLRLEPIKGFEDLSPDEWRAKLLTALRDEENAARKKRQAAGKRVLGRKAVLAARPTDTPLTVAPRRNLRPALACRNEERRRQELTALVIFRAERRRCLQCLASGEHPVIFPVGTYIRGIFRIRPAPDEPSALCA